MYVAVAPTVLNTFVEISEPPRSPAAGFPAIDQEWTLITLVGPTVFVGNFAMVSAATVAGSIVNCSCATSGSYKFTRAGTTELSEIHELLSSGASATAKPSDV